MKILLTGGAGFIGSHIADLFIQEGHHLSIIDDMSKGKKENIPENASFYQLSITDPSIEKVFKKEKPEILVHHAAQVSVNSSVKDPVKDMEINIKGSVILLEAALKHKVNKIIFASTGGAIYGEQNYFPADENHSLKPLSPYGIGKLSAERYIYYYYKTYGLKYTVLRYSNVYGPRQDPQGEAGVVAIFSKKILNHEQPVINGNGDQTRDFVFVKDVARANLLALNNDFIGEFNISTGIETSINRLISLFKSITRSCISEKHGPPLPGEQLRSVLSWKKAGMNLGWRPQTSLIEGLEQTVLYFKNTLLA
jgi:UDP-glucose 4-epimerase